MEFEHFALNIADPVKFVNWYTSNCSMKILKSMNVKPFTHFLADSTGRSIVEIYSNSEARIPDYTNNHYLEFHFAFKVEDVSVMKDKLLSAGAKLLDEIKLENGTHIVTLRDPFGIPIQLCKRVPPLVK